VFGRRGANGVQTAFSFFRRVRQNGFARPRNQPVRLALNEQKCRLKLGN
ncbi:hypothetical protein NTC54_000109, partial [Neisseria gonorrhoeae]